VTDYLEEAKDYLGRSWDEIADNLKDRNVQRGILCALIAIAEGKAAELMPVEVQDRSGDTARGGFRREYTDADNEPCAVIEKPDGTVDTVYVWQARFLDREPAKEPETGDEPEFKCPECGKLHTPEMTYDPEVCGAEPF
jgi:hypothetical protein